MPSIRDQVRIHPRGGIICTAKVTDRNLLTSSFKLSLCWSRPSIQVQVHLCTRPIYGLTLAFIGRSDTKFCCCKFRATLASLYFDSNFHLLFLFHEHPHEESDEFIYPLWFVAWIVKVAVLRLFPLEVDGIAEIVNAPLP